ncbi:unnamed protein product [Blepharisma stoltei]|uniref:Uncharacterized protein n=1 Tax=Blepharisma stoltei TaxID=1481888 RepID=A0AAU9J8E9_9CILI|nr:unnamed protein product [Blepharisma stoltei]
MNSKLLEYFTKNKIKNLYAIHKTSGEKKGIYSLTRPLLEPEEMITSFFSKPTKNQLTEDEKFSQKMLHINTHKNVKIKEGEFGINPVKDSFGSSFGLK